MDIKDLDYCQENYLDATLKLLSDAFNINEMGIQELKRAYKVFTNEFYTSKGEGIITVNRGNCKPITNNEAFLSAFFNSENTVGIDLPVYIQNKSSSKIDIIIVGEDPLREGCDYSENNKKNQIILSTPYATHWKEFREKRGKLYWLFSEFLLKEGYSIYYTDINKIWIKKNKNGNTSKKQQIPVDLKKKFLEILNWELRMYSSSFLVNPTVVTFGKVAQQAVNQIFEDNKSITHIPLPHPSGRNSFWGNVLKDKKQTHENKLEYMMNEFFKRIKYDK